MDETMNGRGGGVRWQWNVNVEFGKKMEPAI